MTVFPSLPMTKKTFTIDPEKRTDAAKALGDLKKKILDTNPDDVVGELPAGRKKEISLGFNDLMQAVRSGTASIGAYIFTEKFNDPDATIDDFTRSIAEKAQAILEQFSSSVS